MGLCLYHARRHAKGTREKRDRDRDRDREEREKGERRHRERKKTLYEYRPRRKPGFYTVVRMCCDVWLKGDTS